MALMVEPDAATDNLVRIERDLGAYGPGGFIDAVDTRTGAVITGPEIITRGWVHASEAEDLLDECRHEVSRALKEACAGESTHDIESLQKVVRRSAGRFVNDRTRRRPMIVPVVMEA